MATGGSRPGAGRKPGGKNRKTIERELNAQAAIALVTTALANDNGELTLEQMANMSEIDVMRHAMILELAAGRHMNAANIAKDIAPYRFARLSQVKQDTTIRRGPHEMTDDELREFIEAGDGESESGDSGEGSGEE